jgi:hypothetical protein
VSSNCTARNYCVIFASPRLVSFVRVVGPESLSTLYDPVLIAMSPQAFTLVTSVGEHPRGR